LSASSAPGLVGAIALSYRDLRRGMAMFLAQKPRDAQLLVLSLLAAVVGFIAGLPRALVQAQTLGVEDPLTAVLSVRLFAALFMTPLLLFGLGALSHLVALGFRGQGSFWAARAAIVWAVIVALPLLVANGLAGGVAMIWPGLASHALASAVSMISSLGFFWIWAQHLAQAEGFAHGGRVFAVFFLLAVTLTATFAMVN